MAKFHGKIGYAVTTETAPGVNTEGVSEKDYRGDVVRNSRHWENDGKVNDNLTINNQLSIIADAYAYSNFSAMRYVIWMGVSWKITNIEIQRPRLILTIGGLYNG